MSLLSAITGSHAQNMTGTKLIGDPDGTQTHDLQNRNLTLYSTELPSHSYCISAAKLRIFIEIFDFIVVFCLKFGFLMLLLQDISRKTTKK